MKTIHVAKALLIDARGGLLVLRRSATHPTLAGASDLPGGIIEAGETPAEAAIREIFEETGLELSSDDLTLLYTGTEAYRGESHIRFLFVYRLKSKQPQIELSWEHDQAEWLSIEDLGMIEKQFHYFYREALDYIRKHGLLTS